MPADAKNCETLSTILKKYCDRSSQLINLNKSSAVFSANVPKNVRQEMAGLLQVPVVENCKTYLGIPLSQGGREMLIKAVSCAILIYTMQCFKVPKKVCDEVNAAMADFWWGQQQEERKIHWES